MCVINMKFLGDVLIQQNFKYICDIQYIYAFKHAWEIFDIDTIVILGYEHLLLIQYPCITNFQAYLWHPKYIGLQTCMGDIWHWHHCDPRLWTLAPCSWHIHSWCRSWGCPYTTSPLVIQQYPYDIFFFPHLANIWHLLFHNPISWLIMWW